MKRFLKVFAGILLLLVGTLAVLPFLFKDKIKALVQEDLNKMLNAQAYFGDVGLSFLADFPNACVSIQDFGVVGIGPFAQDTLASGKNFDLVVDLNSIISGGEIRIKKIRLDKPRIHAIVLADGTANWDIMKPDSSASAAEDTSGSFRIDLQQYELSDALIRYDDATLPMNLRIKGLNHQGKGDFTAETFALETTTNAKEVFTEYDGITYLNRVTLDAAVNMLIDMSKDLRIELTENQLTVNALTVALEGFVEMPGDDINMDLRYEAQQTTFGSLLSLVPGVYTADFADIKTEGNLLFDGFVKGTYNETRLPGFGLNLKVDNARIQYPDVPKPITGINMDLSVNNPDGDLEKTAINLRALHADFGSNPIDATAEISGLERMKVVGQLKAKLNLGELTSMFPVEGTELRGTFLVDATANGVYEEASGRFPQVDARMAMDNGYLKNAEYPAELSELTFHGEFKDTNGSLSSAVFDMPDFHFLLDGEPLDGNLHVENLDDPTYRLAAKGVLDLEKLMQIYPIDSMSLKGRLVVEDFTTAGKYSDIEAERYLNLPTSGRVLVQNLEYSDSYLAAPVTVTQGTAVFSPARIDISGAKGMLGSSDYAVDGYFSNYLAYALMDNQPLSGQMSLRSKRLDINEWMEEETTSSGSGEEESYEVIPVPDNLNLNFQADLGEVLYDDLVLKQMKGNIQVADQAVNMEDVTFGMLGGRVAMSGQYETKNIRQPTYHFYLNVQELMVQKIAETFAIATAYAPALKFIDGVCNTELGISGLLGSDMMPIMESVNSLGLFTMLQGGIKNTPMLTSLSSKTKLSQLSSLDLANAAGKFEIKDGFLNVSPIDLKLQDILIQLGGRQSLTGNLDYTVQIDAPSGKLGEAAVSALSNLTKTTLQSSERIVLNLKVGGTSQKPTISGGGGGTTDQLKDQLAKTAEDKLKEQTGVDVSLNKDSLKQKAAETKTQVTDSVKAVVAETKAQVTDTLKAVVEEKKEEAKEAIGEKVEETIGKEAKEQLDNLKDRFGLPKKKKKN